MADHTQEAERAAHEWEWSREKKGFTTTSEMRSAYIAGFLASRRAVAADTGVDGLPALDKPVGYLYSTSGDLHFSTLLQAAQDERDTYEAWHSDDPDIEHEEPEPVYTAEQARQAQCEAVAADRAKRQPVLDEQASVMLTHRKKIQQLEAVVRAEVDDMMRIYEALGLSDSDVLDAEVVIQRIADLRAELASRGAAQGRTTSVDSEELRDAARYQYIEEHATTTGGGNGFTITCFVPVDEEDIGAGIDKAIAAVLAHGKAE